jgi:hypothetical protein
LADHGVEPVEKPLGARSQGIEGSFKVSFDIGHPRKSDCSALYAMTFPGLSKAILLRGFFYRLVRSEKNA